MTCSTTDRREGISDPFARGGPYHWIWWAGPTFIRPGVYFRHARILPVSRWLTQPRREWRAR